MSLALLGMDVAEEHSKEYGFVVLHQRLVFEIDFPMQSLTGRTEITINPQTRSLDYIRIDARQCVIPEGKITVDGVAVQQYKYDDRLDLLNNREYIDWGVEQYEQQRERLKDLMEETRTDGALVIRLPPGVKIEELDLMSDFDTTANASSRSMGVSAARHSSVAIDTGSARANTPMLTPRLAVDQSSRYKPLTISIPFSVKKFRDGVHFAGMAEGDTQYPHAYSRHSMDPGTACSIFPCVDDPAMRCTWDVVVTCSRTLGDAMKRKPRKETSKKNSHTNGVASAVVNGDVLEDDQYLLSEEDKRLEMIIKCSGELMHEVDDPDDSSKKVATFACDQIVAAKHIGFGIGPFELVELSDFREEQEGEKIGQGQSSPVYAYCLPGRSAEVRHVCTPIAHALDMFMLRFGSYPFSDYCILFVDGQINDSEHTAGLSICTDRLLYPPDMIDPEPESVRTLVHALASQWIGVSVVAERNVDRWLIVGISHYMAGLFMKSLCGENDYMFRQKQLCDELVVQDVERPSLHQLGNIIHLGRFEMEFMKLKAPLVLFILDRRLFKFTSRTAGLERIISKLITSANINPTTDSAISTATFRRQCEKLTRYRQTDSFFNQWVLGAGCPRMNITHKFNKKRLQIELTITQLPPATSVGKKLQKDAFLREVKEEVHGVYAGELRPYFTGSMTIRIHEADGSPYDHVVEIKSAQDTIYIPYVTKYKRVRRALLKKDRAAAQAQGEVNGEVNEETVLYSLGDNIQTDEEMEAWGMQDYEADIKKVMEQENYEWIRIDSDFEWLCAREIKMPSYMFVSQLQQDQNVEAQQESLHYFATAAAIHPVAATVLTRTLMDPRYFHGIRTTAARLLQRQAHAPDWIGLKQLQKATSELFCYPGTMMPRSNDFTDRRSYYVELAIPEAMSNIRDVEGKCPKEARNFIMDQLRFNDNTDNEYSDVCKIACLLKALTNSLVPQEGIERILEGDLDEDEEIAAFRAKAIEELDRHRRMDEWINSYQNILTTTVLDCKMRLMKAKVIPIDRNEFLRYLIEGNLEQVRIKAFEALIELGFLNNPGVLKFLICCLSTDSSPYVRNRLFEVFVRGLASIAIGEDVPKPAKVEPEGGLQVEHDIVINTPEMQALVVRTTTIDGAMAALRATVKDNEIWKEAIWNALCSDVLSFSEHLDLLDMCQILFDPKDKMVVKLPLPRFWIAEKLTQTKITFKQTGSLRYKPLKVQPVLPPSAPISTIPAPQPAANRTMLPAAVPALPSVPTPVRTNTGIVNGGSGKIRISLPGASKLANPAIAAPKPVVPKPLSTVASKPAVPKPVVPKPAVSKPVSTVTPKPPPSSTPKPSSMAASMAPSSNKVAATSIPKPVSISVSRSSSSVPSKPAPVIGTKPASIPKAPKPPVKREADGNSAIQTLPKRRMVVKLHVNGGKLSKILARTPSPTMPLSTSRPAPRPEVSASKKRKSDSPPSASTSLSHKKMKSDNSSLAPPRDMAAPKKTSTSRRSPAPKNSPAPAPSSTSVAARVALPTTSSSPASSSTNGTKPPRQRLPDGPPKQVPPPARAPSPTPSNPDAPKSLKLIFKLPRHFNNSPKPSS